jgi:hypothetical protein
MDISKILAELKAECAQIDEAIFSLERMMRGRARAPGRPPNWMTEENTPKRGGRPPGSRTPPENLPPAAAMGLPIPHPPVIWAVAGKKRPAS